MLFYFVPCINCLLNLLVVEKESRIKESLVIIGLKRSIFWFSWIVIYGVIIIMSVVLVTLIMHLTNLYIYIHWSLTITVLFIYGLSCCCISFILSTLVKKSKTANVIGVMVIICFFVIYFLSLSVLDTSKSKQILNFAISPLAFITIFNELNEFETAQLPTSFTTLLNTPSLRNSLLGLVISLFIYLFYFSCLFR